MLTRFFSLVFVLSLLITVHAAELIPYKIDNNHSHIGFAVSIMGGLSKVHGKFTDYSIRLLNDEADITKSKVTVSIKAGSISTGIKARDEHLRTADFFDVENYPNIIFKSNRIEKKGEGFIAHGDLTMHGVTKRISLPFVITGVSDDKKERKKNVGYAAKMSLNRKDYGISWNKVLDSGGFVLGDEVDILINIEGVLQAAEKSEGDTEG